MSSPKKTHLSSSSNNSSSNPNLPTELIIEILSRLPVKHILKSKSVSKLWLALIQNPTFTFTHLNAQQSNQENLIIVNNTNNKTPKKLDLKLIFRAENRGVINLDPPFLGVSSFFKVVGSCNGLLCVSVSVIGTDVYLWNLGTRKCWNIPEPRLKVPQPQGKTQQKRGVLLGFGWEPVTNDYKVVRFLLGGNLNGPPERTVEVYSKARDCWNRANTYLQCRISESSVSACFNGGIHWMGSKVDESEVIACFDLSKDAFKEMGLPDCPKFGVEIGKDVSVVKGCLAIVAYPLSEELSKCVDVWVMKEYGVVESWTKLLRVGPFSGISKPLVCFKSGAIVLQNNKNKMLLYDGTKRKFEKLPVFRAPYVCDIHTYVESLVSVYGGC